MLKKLIDDSYSFGTIITSDRRYSDIDIKHKRKAFKQISHLMILTLQKSFFNKIIPGFVFTTANIQILTFISYIIYFYAIFR